jgi:hypothetical protein
LCYLIELKDLWWSIFCVYDRFHTFSSKAVCHLLNADWVFDLWEVDLSYSFPMLLWGQLSTYCLLDSNSHESQKSTPDHVDHYAAYETCGK